ncbi:MAG: hypothetical protein ACYC7E_07170 [Armatimonadota bacterium]
MKSKLGVLLLLCVTLCLCAPVLGAVPVHGEYNLADFGPVGTTTDAQNTLVNLAIPQIIAAGGGVLVVAPGVCSTWVVDYDPPSTALYPQTPTVTIIDRRLGYQELFTPAMGKRGLTWSGERVMHNIRTPIDMTMGSFATKELRTNIAGVTASYLQAILNDPSVGPGNNLNVFVPTIRGLAVGMKVIITGVVGGYGGNTDIPTIEALGWDAATQRSYVVVDLTYAHAKGVLLYDKHWISSMVMTANSQSDNQSATMTVKRNIYGEGDAFGISTSIKNMSNIMSAGGDEGGVGNIVDVYNELDPFHSTVSSINWTTNELVYATGAVRNHTLGTSRPIINMNAAKHITAGTVYIVPPGYTDPTGIDTGTYANGAILGYNCNWTSAVVGRFFAVDEPGEYLDPANDPAAGYTAAPPRRIWRWWAITKLDPPRSDGSQRIYIERTSWWSYNDRVPNLWDFTNYSQPWRSPTPLYALHYKIAPGAYVADISRAWTDSEVSAGYVYSTSPRTLKLAKSSDAGSPTHDFAADDAIEQAIGQDPWNPTGMRVRHHNYLPTSIGDASFQGTNNGRVAVQYGLSIDGGTGSIAEIDTQKDSKPKYLNAINIQATTKFGIYFGGDHLGTNVNYPGNGTGDAGAMIWFAQPHSRTQYTSWAWTGGWTSLWVDPSTGHAYLKDSGNSRPLHTPGLCLDNHYVGISATTTPAKNLRGINRAVTQGATTYAVTFAVAEPDATYAVSVTPTWNTTVWVTNKATTGFTVNFGTAAPSGAKCDWIIIR